jgi:hypothetical protein
MKPETKEFFDRLEPLVQATSLVDGKRITDFSQLGPVDVDTLYHFTMLYCDPRHCHGMDAVLNEVWETFVGKRINSLIDRPKYTSFEFTLTGQLALVNATIEHCGRHEECIPLTGKAQRMYLCNILAQLNVNMPVHLCHERDFVFKFDGTHLHLNPLSNEAVTA